MNEKIRTIIRSMILIAIAIAIIIQLTTQKDIEQETSAIILNLKKTENAYRIENPSEEDVNVTIFEENEITGSVILDPDQSVKINKENFIARGEKNE